MAKKLDNGDDDEAQLEKLAHDHTKQGNFVKALEVIEDSISIRGIHKLPENLHFLQGSIFYKLATRTENSDLKFPFLLASVECFAHDSFVHVLSAASLYHMGELLGSVSYYKKAINDAKQSLSVIKSHDDRLTGQENRSQLEDIIQMANVKILLGPTAKNSRESKLTRDTVRSDSDSSSAGKRLRSYWAGMNVESKREFLKVSIVELRRYVERIYGREGVDSLEQVLESVRINRKWKFWMCRTCSRKFYYLKKFKSHLEQEHAAKFKPSTTKVMAQRVDDFWASMISVSAWEPVDAVVAAEMIKTRLEFVKEFVYENGWPKDWPLAVNEERMKLLKEIQLLLMLFRERQILSCSLRDWMMHFVVKHLAQFDVSEHTLTTECHLLETPQSVCFLECHELSQILNLLKHIKTERDNGAHLISRAVDSLWSRTRVKENIEFDHQYSFMLLDKRLLRGKIASFDDEGTMDVCDHNVHYAKTHPQGDDIITWLLDYPLIDESFEFPRSIRARNLDVWAAVLRAIHFTCRTVGIKYSKKLVILTYDSALNYANDICINEDERRMNTPEDQWNPYASLLGEKCEEQLRTDIRDSLTSELLLCAVRDVLEVASHPTFDFPDLDDCLNRIHGRKNLSDVIVLKSIDLLKSVVANMVPLVDSKILLVENSRTILLNDLTKLSVFDYRSYILHLLKRFLREELDEKVNMDAKTKSAAAQAEILSEKKQVKKTGPKKKKHRTNKRTSTSLSSLIDHNVEYESSANLEPGVISPSLKTLVEDCMESEDSLSSGRGRLEFSSNTDPEEAVNKDTQNMPGEDSLSKDLESTDRAAATNCSSALDITLKALCNIKVLKEELVHNRQKFPDNLEEEISIALRNFFISVVSEEIKEEGLYSYLLGNLLASLDFFHLMSSHAAEVLVTILEFWPCWKSPERENLVTCLFMLEEYERMSCSKCRRKPNYPEQSSYGIVVAADSIRDLKCAFGNIKFEDILKVIRMEDKMLCDVKTGGCGKASFVHHIISRSPPIFTIVLEWEKDNTEKEVSDTTKALEWEIDISRLYDGLKSNTKYRLVSMIGCGEEEEYICLAYIKNRWFSLRHESLAEEAVGNWKSVVRFCGEKKIRPEILFYEAVQWPNKWQNC